MAENPLTDELKFIDELFQIVRDNKLLIESLVRVVDKDTEKLYILLVYLQEAVRAFAEIQHESWMRHIFREFHEGAAKQFTDGLVHFTLPIKN